MCPSFEPKATQKELQVLDLAADGIKQKEIAAHLGNTHGRIANILRDVRDKTATDSTAHALQYAKTHGWLNPERENLKIVQEAFDALNSHDGTCFASLLHKQHVWKSGALPEPVYGSDAVRQTFERYWAIFPDLHFHWENQLAIGNHVTVHWRATATHRGTFAGIPSTGRGTEVYGVGLYVVEESRIVQATSRWNVADLIEQIGGPIRGRYAP